MQPIEAVIFDTDGVVTRTAAVHMAAWKRVFDSFLANHAGGGADTRPFTDDDYRSHVDGVGRYDGVERFLASRGITLPHGDPGDPPGSATICAVANTKNEAFERAVADDGVQPYATTRRFIEELHAVGIRTAVISASKNCALVLAEAGMDDLFEVRVDGLDQAELGFPGKPEPDVFIEAATRLGLTPGSCVVVEDAISGVTAGRAGGFAQVVGLDRSLNPGPLAEHADIVVPDAADLEVVPFGGGHRVGHRVPASARIADLPSALGDHDFQRRTEGRPIAVFCDYDGTLAPIVGHPADAVATPDAVAAVEALAAKVPVAIISGRDLDDVRSMLDSDQIWYAGSHGFEIRAPGGTRHDVDAGSEAAGELDAAQAELEPVVEAAEGAWLERKKFGIAVHYRASPDSEVPALEAAVEGAAEQFTTLRAVGGKKIFELRPAFDWHKGRALRWLLDTIGAPRDVVPLFLGDDLTDEDAFAEIRLDGVGIVVASTGDTSGEGPDGDRGTAAHDRLEDPQQTLEFLERLSENY